MLLIDSTQNSEKLVSGGLDPVVLNDRELNGEINRAATQGAKFSLLLAMLEQNNLQRPKFAATADAEVVKTDKIIEHYYRSSPLEADENNWVDLQQAAEWINSGDIQNAHLWLVMHPEPLSQFNNPSHLTPDVVANCSYPTQIRIRQARDNPIQEPAIKVDETGLYDVLQQLSAG